MYLIDSKQRIPGFHPPESNVADATDVSNLTASTEQITNSGQIKGFVLLTQAEYDALPASKETDGIAYLIRG